MDFSAKQFLYIKKTFTILCLLTVATRCSRNDETDVLAYVGERTVTAGHLTERLADFKKKVGTFNTTGQQLQQLLAGIVDEELLISEAWKIGFGDDALAQNEKKRLEIQEMLDQYHKTFVRPGVKVSEAELHTLFARFNTKVKARHLYAASKPEADSLYELLQNGADFTELAKKVFHSPELRRSGGSVGYFSVDEMDPFFEDAAYNLGIGEISKPVKTAAGYSIIQVEDKTGNPILTESRFAQQKNHLKKYWYNHKIQRSTREHADSIAAALKIKFNNDTVRALFEIFSEKNNQPDLMRNKDAENFVSDKTLLDAELVESRIGNWKVRDFQEKAKFTSEKQQNWIRNDFALREFISGLIIREAMLEKARAFNFHQSAEYKKAVEENMETWLLTRMEDQIDSEIVVSEDTMRAYYAEEPERFAEAAQFALNEIVVLKKETADSAKKQLDSGRDFDDVRRNFSIFPDPKKETGFYPFYPASDFGELASEIENLKIGAYIGPVNIEEKFVFFRCEGKRPAKLRSFEDARSDVEQALKYMLRDQYRANKVNKIKEDNTVSVFYDKIKSLRLK
ncbi:MAG: hypothetical protein DWQ05_06585 [Calditrichaeota bacterium]|nr:MAG: hypothetical protein DWQ05_06585 [Calditrichota bacterium]